MSTTKNPPVLILGAGVHGAAIALELVLNGVPVHLVDKFDVAYGATSKSSRLIHGGLRYLEYGDFQLVRESLNARSLNLQNAPQFVQELKLFIPTSRRWSGMIRSTLGFLGLSRTRWGRRFAARKTERGFWPVRIGLWIYDRRSSSMPVGAPGTPRVNLQRYRWLCSYADAQMPYPERLVLALLAEAKHVTDERDIGFHVSTYSQADFEDGHWRIRDTLTDTPAMPLQPSCIVNATGAWGDHTLEQLKIESRPLFGGTKGTHFITWNDTLRRALQGHAVYAEADDGRLVFVLPFGDGVLVGTTDETFASKPETAAATEEELDYLLRLVNEVMDCRLTRDDITLHYSGVRPLPKTVGDNNSAVSRDHAVVEHHAGNCPIFTLVGGKLTTWREFAREVSDRVLTRLKRPRTHGTQQRGVLGDVYPGRFDSQGIPWNCPRTPEEQQQDWTAFSREFTSPFELFAALFPLYGCRTAEILKACESDLGAPIHGTAFTAGIVRWVIDQEWVRTLSDLVERRLMLVFSRELSHQTLDDLAGCLAASGRLSASDVPAAVKAAEERLERFFGRRPT